MLDGGAENDQLYGGNDNDELLGGDGSDYLEGGLGNDSLNGGLGNDLLDAGDGNDSLIGGEDSDELLGGLGNDFLEGGTGNDILTGGGGIDRFLIKQNDGIDVITDLTGIGRGNTPVPAVLAETDVIQFQGADLVAKNMLLTQNGNNLEITFEGISNTHLILNDFALENLDNLGRGPGTSAQQGNIQFLSNEKSPLEDSFDIFNAEWQNGRVLNRNTVTFLNDLDNDISGFDNSNDVINGQGGNDILTGLGSDDILRGGLGNDTLIGGSGVNILTGNEGADVFVFSLNGTSTITDFTVGQDFIGLAPGLTVSQLKIEQGTGVNSSSTWVKLANDDSLLLTLKGVKATDLTTTAFLPDFGYQNSLFS